VIRSDKIPGTINSIDETGVVCHGIPSLPCSAQTGAVSAQGINETPAKPPTPLQQSFARGFETTTGTASMQSGWRVVTHVGHACVASLSTGSGRIPCCCRTIKAVLIGPSALRVRRRLLDWTQIAGWAGPCRGGPLDSVQRPDHMEPPLFTATTHTGRAAPSALGPQSLRC
jgi:hypothetical protein